MAFANKRRLEDDEESDPAKIRKQRAAFLNSISRSITPPPTTRKEAVLDIDDKDGEKLGPPAIQDQGTRLQNDGSMPKIKPKTSDQKSTTKTMRSPFKLTRIRDLPAGDNIDTISLHDILGNPLIKEAWVFNFCFDVDWMMTHFDPDVRRLVKVKLVHGSWRKEDGNRLSIDDACKRWSNVESICAYIPDPFGTHHSKMFVLFTHDDQVEVVIHTANILERDWTNITQAVWRSGLLPQLKTSISSQPGRIGSGSRFQHDLSSYLRAYGKKLQPLVNQIQNYDFRSIRAAIVASVPSKVRVPDTLHDPVNTVWGHLRLQQVLSAINGKEKSRSNRTNSGSEHLVWQISSIATLSSQWLDMFCHACFYPNKGTLEDVSIIFPTSTNVQHSLDGYESGVSIHTKAQSSTHLKQINGMRRQLHQWSKGPLEKSRSGRHEAAPHIKTYMKFASKPSMQNPTPDIDWLLLTSANLSTQAWGSIPKVGKESSDKSELLVQVQSFELGVMLWPELFAENTDGDNTTQNLDAASTTLKGNTNDSYRHPNMRMRPVFGKDLPDAPEDLENTTGKCTVIGVRMPYDLPLTPYGQNELPWSSHSSHLEPDRHGKQWRV